MKHLRSMLLLVVLTVALSPASSQQKGKASFYAKKFTGRRTASGERLHSDSMTCAHRTYPFGTLLKVTNPANKKSVIVRVNDRGPFVKGRIIDLSRRAARELGIISAGVATVRVEKYTRPVGIPFKIEETFYLPELDLEVTTNPGMDYKPIWQIEEQDKIANKQKPEEKGHKQAQDK